MQGIRFSGRRQASSLRYPVDALTSRDLGGLPLPSGVYGPETSKTLWGVWEPGLDRLENKILDADHGVKGGFRRRVAVETLDAMVPSKQGLPSDPGRSADLSWSELRTHTSSAAAVALFDVLELHNCLRCPRSVHGERAGMRARVTLDRPLPPHPTCFASLASRPRIKSGAGSLPARERWSKLPGIRISRFAPMATALDRRAPLSCPPGDTP